MSVFWKKITCQLSYLKQIENVIQNLIFQEYNVKLRQLTRRFQITSV